MKFSKSHVFSLFVVLALSACSIKRGDGTSDNKKASGSVSASQNSQSEKYVYQYIENGCDTGKHEFSSFSAYCDGLQDQNLNNGCARTLRVEAFRQKGCPGTFQSFIASESASEDEE